MNQQTSIEEQIEKTTRAITGLELKKLKLEFQKDWEEILPEISFHDLAAISQKYNVPHEARLAYEQTIKDLLVTYGKQIKNLAESYYEKKHKKDVTNTK